MRQKKQPKSPLQSLPGETKTAGIWQNLRIPIYWLVLSSLNVNQRLTKKLNFRLKKHLRRDILLRLCICANAQYGQNNCFQRIGSNMPTLDWIGKKAVINHDKQVPFHLLNEVPESSYGDKDSGNMLIQGDNLIALKSLLPYYAGKVKCIYIDPPYNTGNEGWIYNDNVNSPEIKEWLGNVVGKEAEDLSRHDKWLCMMYPRLKLLREFLREDGVILISIDDNENDRFSQVDLSS